MSAGKLYYWGVPGKGEMIRLAIHVTGSKIEDCPINGEAYGALKERLGDKALLMNLPLLEVGDEVFTESKAILRYVGAQGGLVPCDPLKALRSDEIVDVVDDMFHPIGGTFAFTDPEEKMEARRQLLVGPEGKLFKYYSKIESYLGKMSGPFVGGEDLCLGDIALFGTMLVPVAGFLDGFPTDALDAYPNITAYRKRVGSHPKVASRYANVTEGTLLAYKV
jgi:glutathione S-transferase